MAYRKLPDLQEMSPVVKEWLESLPLYEDKPATTIRAYSQGVRRVVSFSDLPPGEFGATSLDQAALTNVVREMRASGEVSKSTLTQTLASLKSFFDFCIGNGHAESVPDIARIRKVAKLAVQQVDPDYLRPDEIDRLYKEALDPREPVSSVRWGTRDLAMCAFLVILGLRASEAISADVGWITREVLDPVSGRATWMMRVLGKGQKIRLLPLSAELDAVNRRWQEEREERFGPARLDEPLFLTNDGERFNYPRLRYWLEKIYMQAGLAGSSDSTRLATSNAVKRGRSLHSLRHTAGVQLAYQSVSTNMIQNFLGHASIATTGIYTDLAGGALVEAVENSDNNTLLGNALKDESIGGS
ncbi:MAG: tyrosine-type recombinase/integrase [Actinobacteria bacterium]|nr:tyrosine-type recombinase/integrase [Actinomycetota bacterium]